MPSAWSSPSTAATDAGIAPRWTGMCSACMTISPWASKSAVEQSWRSLMLAECALRMSTAPISSQAARSAPVATCRAMGSRSATAQDHRPGRVAAPAPAVRHDERRLGQGDDRRPGDGPGVAVVAGLPADVGAGLDPRGAHGDELDVGLGVAIAVALLVGGGERLAQRARLRPDVAQRELVRLP